MEFINDGQWISGLDSISYTLSPGMYAWGQNVINRGGIIGTRQGFTEIASVAQRDPRGLGYITVGGVTWLMAAIGNYIYKLNVNNPVDGLQRINKADGTPALIFEAYTEPQPPNPAPPIPVPKRMVHFELCVQAQESIYDQQQKGFITKQLPSPKFVMVIQDGFSRPQYWDPGAIAAKQAGYIDELYSDDSHSIPTPTGVYMQWAGDRLWVVQGRKVRASNLLNPFQFTEESVTASGGNFFLPDIATGIGVTHDYKALLVFTHFTTTAFQVGLEDRTQWPSTQDFQRVIFPSIGCASHRTIINMYGMTWWMSHDGLVGLDNAMAAYQTTRLDIKDLNMIRSKEGLSWSAGGGAAGSFGNFLFFSVPSASKWNQHTWIMDQAPVSILAGTSAPTWSSNWTGVRPEQWVTCQVDGQQRCFCISRDLTDTGHQSTVWEAFIGQRMDVPKVGNTVRSKDIGCAFESRFLGLSPSQYTKLRWIEVDVSEIVGDVTLRVYYCGRRTSYKQIINTHLTATVSSTTEEVFNPDDPIKVNVPQYRTVRSYTDTHTVGDNDSEIQTPYLRNKDREFSVLVQWSGQMAVSSVRVAVDTDPDYMEGTDFKDEYLQRTITAEGEGTIGCTLPPANAPTGQLTSKFLAPCKPRWIEFPAYDSAVPNGVFFVDELSAAPPPEDYPLNLYPMTVNLTSETAGIDIYYTLDGSNPRPPPNSHGTKYDASHRPVVNVNKTLKAQGYRDGLRPSTIFMGHYTQSKVADVILTPPPGGFPSDEFKQVDPPYTGPLIAYNFNEGTSHTVGDSSPNNIDGQIQGTISWNTAGKHGKALNFDGSTSWVLIGQPLLLKFSGSMTLSAWINVSMVPPFNGANLIVGRNNLAGGWSLYTDFFGRAFISVASAVNTFATRSNVNPLTLNTWTHITGVYNAHAATLDMYVNGVLDNGTLTGTVPHAQSTQPLNVAIGRMSNNTGFFHGIIDDVRVYDRVITQAEITADMNTGVVPPPPPPAGFPVTMACATGGAEIHFVTTDGSPSHHLHNVTKQDPKYKPSDPPHPFADQTIRAKAFKDFYLDGDQENGYYFIEPRCMTPTLTPDEGEYPEGNYPISVKLAAGTAGSKLRYTLNDVDVEHGTQLTKNPDHVNVNINDTLRVIAQKDGFANSFTKKATYTKLLETVSDPTFDPPDPIRLPRGQHAININVATTTAGASINWTVTGKGLDPDPPTSTHGFTIASNSGIIQMGENATPPTRIGHWVVQMIAYKTGSITSQVTTCHVDQTNEN